MLRNRVIWLYFGILALIIASSILMMRVAGPPVTKPRIRATEAGEGHYYTVKDTQGRILLRTGLPVNAGDIFINEKNHAFKIFQIAGWAALARPTSLPSPKGERDEKKAGLFSRPDTAIPTQTDNIHVAMYHTHSDESFPISDATTSIPGSGTIFEVGDTMAESLRAGNISVTHSDNTHGPHDENAYYRSRRTVFQLLKQRPDAVFDVHRDSAPAEEYYTLINGLVTARSMIVVGRQNPHMGTNLAFARRIKAHADEVYPGLIRGIFIGHGNYNQDLYPTSLLIEIGTDQLSLESAERGASSLGDVVSDILHRHK